MKTTTEHIEGQGYKGFETEFYIVHHHYEGEKLYAVYDFIKVVQPGKETKVYRCDRLNCNCPNAKLGKRKAPLHKCKHSLKAVELDTLRTEATTEENEPCIKWRKQPSHPTPKGPTKGRSWKSKTRASMKTALRGRSRIKLASE